MNPPLSLSSFNSKTYLTNGDNPCTDTDYMLQKYPRITSSDVVGKTDPDLGILMLVVGARTAWFTEEQTYEFTGSRRTHHRIAHYADVAWDIRVVDTDHCLDEVFLEIGSQRIVQLHYWNGQWLTQAFKPPNYFLPLVSLFYHASTIVMTSRAAGSVIVKMNMTMLGLQDRRWLARNVHDMEMCGGSVRVKRGMLCARKRLKPCDPETMFAIHLALRKNLGRNLYLIKECHQLIMAELYRDIV